MPLNTIKIKCVKPDDFTQPGCQPGVTRYALWDGKPEKPDLNKSPRCQNCGGLIVPG